MLQLLIVNACSAYACSIPPGLPREKKNANKKNDECKTACGMHPNSNNNESQATHAYTSEHEHSSSLYQAMHQLNVMRVPGTFCYCNQLSCPSPSKFVPSRRSSSEGVTRVVSHKGETHIYHTIMLMPPVLHYYHHALPRAHERLRRAAPRHARSATKKGEKDRSYSCPAQLTDRMYVNVDYAEPRVESTTGVHSIQGLVWCVKLGV